ncbi:MAG: hypothetical protein D6748_11885 [Calditrichaeota bacterium]|nr:MAG: hypothetical protein D6748_11885 [Calditrichota bacterium]
MKSLMVNNIVKFILLSLLVTLTPLLSQQKIDGIAAVVGDKIILMSDLNTILAQYSLQTKTNIFENPQLYRQLTQRFLQQMIDEKLLLIKAEEDTITADEERVDQILQQQLDQMVKQVGSLQALEQYYGSPIAKIKKDFRKQISEQLIIEQLRQKRFSNVKISRREVEDFFQEYQDSLPKLEPTVDISHILMQVKPSDESFKTAFEKISQIRKKLEEGEDFATLASQYSEDPGSRRNGGDLGWVSRGTFVREFEEAAFALKPGEISDIVQTQFGFHIIQLLDRQGEKIHARHILIQLQPTREDEQKIIAKLQEIRQKILSGEATFEEMALKYSDDPNVEKDKGHLGEYTIGNFQVKAFEDAIKNLQPGEISEPFKTEFGYHIVRLNKRTESRTYSLEKDWQTIEKFAIDFKRGKEFRKWLSQLREEIPIQIHLEI